MFPYEHETVYITTISCNNVSSDKGKLVSDTNAKEHDKFIHKRS